MDIANRDADLQFDKEQISKNVQDTAKARAGEAHEGLFDYVRHIGASALRYVTGNFGRHE
jgi:hypothetical protein